MRWRVEGSSGGAGFKLRVLHPEGFGTYTGAGTSATGTPVSVGTQVFTTNLAIHIGDLIGLEPTSTSESVGSASTSGSMVGIWQPPLADGSTLGPSNSGGPLEFALNADVQPPPGVSSLGPSSGPATGGTSVTIAGHDFTGATGADCVLGKVKPKGQTTGKVKKQKPKAGAVLPEGSKVNVKLG